MVFKAEEDNIEIKEGPDFLCELCPYFDGQGCSHPKGDEKAVRKWDIKILEGLALEYGQVIEVSELKSLIREKMPLNFCLTKCPYYRETRCNPQKIPTDLS